MLARKLGHFRPNPEHPINAVWARFHDVKEWDSYDWRERFRIMLIVVAPVASGPRTICSAAAGGFGLFSLRGGDVSAGIVYDNRISNCRKARISLNDCMRTFSVILSVVKFLARQKRSKATCTPCRCCHITVRRSAATVGRGGRRDRFYPIRSTARVSIFVLILPTTSPIYWRAV